MNCFSFINLSLILGLSTSLIGQNNGSQPDPFLYHCEGCTFSPISLHPYYPFKPGDKKVLRGEEGGIPVQLDWEVLHQTRVFTLEDSGGIVEIHTAIIREIHTEAGEIVEISWNFFAQCQETGSVFYFGEEVDVYEDGEVVGHPGAWLAGESGNIPGVIMPGTFVVGDSYYQEFAPGIAEDIAYNSEEGIDFDIPLGSVSNVIVVEEIDPLSLGTDLSLKRYAPDIGLVMDDSLLLVEMSEAPALVIDRAIRLSWRDILNDYILEKATDPNGPWTPSEFRIEVAGGQSEAWVLIGSNPEYFRLVKP